MTGIPTRQMEREHFLDVLRGFALLGIFIANLAHLSMYKFIGKLLPNGIYSSFDGSMEFLHTMLIEGKFYTIFSLLFGWGLALQMQRLSDQDLNPLVLIKRRIWAMLLLGLVHLFLVWPGDIVAFYAMMAFVLLLFRNSSGKKLLWWGACLVLSPIILYFAKMQWQWLNAPAFLLRESGIWIDVHLNHLSENDPGPNPANTKTWIEIWSLNLGGAPFRYAYLLFVSRIPKVLGVFLIGFYLGRNGRYKKILSDKPLLLKLAMAGYILGLPANYMLAHFSSYGEYFQLKMNGWYQTISYAFGVVPLGIAYASTLALAFQSNALRKFLMLLQPVGKMAFSNYMMQSLVAIFTFYGVGLGKGGTLGPTAWTLYALAVFLFQILFSYTWLRFFHFGPVEWLWRSMTYRKWQPFRKTGTVVEA